MCRRGHKSSIGKEIAFKSFSAMAFGSHTFKITLLLLLMVAPQIIEAAGSDDGFKSFSGVTKLVGSSNFTLWLSSLASAFLLVKVEWKAGLRIIKYFQSEKLRNSIGSFWGPFLS